MLQTLCILTHKCWFSYPNRDDGEPRNLVNSNFAAKNNTDILWNGRIMAEHTLRCKVARTCVRIAAQRWHIQWSMSKLLHLIHITANRHENLSLSYCTLIFQYKTPVSQFVLYCSLHLFNPSLQYSYAWHVSLHIWLFSVLAPWIWFYNILYSLVPHLGVGQGSPVVEEVAL